MERPRLVLTDPPPLPADERCPKCGAGRDRRMVAPTYGKAHDMCSACAYEFSELTVSDTQETSM